MIQSARYVSELGTPAVKTTNTVQKMVTVKLVTHPVMNVLDLRTITVRNVTPIMNAQRMKMAKTLRINAETSVSIEG